MPDSSQLEPGEKYHVELTSHDNEIKVATDVGLPDNCSLIVLQEMAIPTVDGSVWVEATVEKLIRADDEVEYVVLDVLSVSVESLQMGHQDAPDHETDPDERTDQIGDSLDAIANNLVGEIQLKQRTNREDGSVVTDGYGERDKADSTPSSDRERAVRRRHRNSK